MEGQIRYLFTGYATQEFEELFVDHHSVLTTFVVAAAQQVCAGLSVIFCRLELLIVSNLFYMVGTIIESQAYDIQRYVRGVCCIKLDIPEFFTLQNMLLRSFILFQFSEIHSFNVI